MDTQADQTVPPSQPLTANQQPLPPQMTPAPVSKVRKKRFIGYGISTALLLPPAHFIALEKIYETGLVQEGDTTFAWLWILLFVPALVTMAAVIGVSRGSNRKRYIVLALLITTVFYAGVFALFAVGNTEFPSDGIPFTLQTCFIWLMAWVVTNIPTGILLLQKPAVTPPQNVLPVAKDTSGS